MLKVAVAEPGAKANNPSVPKELLTKPGVLRHTCHACWTSSGIAYSWPCITEQGRSTISAARVIWWGALIALSQILQVLLPGRAKEMYASKVALVVSSSSVAVAETCDRQLKEGDPVQQSIALQESQRQHSTPPDRAASPIAEPCKWLRGRVRRGGQ